MATQDNCCIKVTACPITYEVANNNGVSCPSRNTDMISIEPKIKLKLCLASGNPSSPTIVKFKAKYHRGIIYNLSRNTLKLDNISGFTSHSWSCVSNMISDIKNNVPFQLNNVHWQEQTLEDQDQLVAMVLQEARSMAATSGVRGMCLSIKKEAFLEHDAFVDCVLDIERWTRTQEVLERCVSRVRPQVDVETVKREIVAGFLDCGVFNRLTHRELDVMVGRVLGRLSVPE